MLRNRVEVEAGIAVVAGIEVDIVVGVGIGLDIGAAGSNLVPW